MTVPSQNTVPARWRDAWLIVLLAPALLAGCYSAGFLAYDDAAHYRHELMRPTTPLSDFWKVTDHSTYFPVTILSYRFDRWLYESVLPQLWPQAGPAPGVRFNSLLLHILAAVCVWRALLKLKVGRWIALFAAAAWVAHPAACESVCWISERKNVLAALFGFASLWVYFNPAWRTLPRLLLTAGLFGLAMLSKPTAAGFLPVYILHEFLELRAAHASKSPGFEGPLTCVRGSYWSRLLPSIAFFVLLAGLIIFLAKINIGADKDASVQRAGGSVYAVILTDIPILVEYIYNSLWPLSLSIFYHNIIITSIFDLTLWLNLALLAALFVGTMWLSEQKGRTLFLWGWFGAALGPALNIISLPYLMQDRYAYFALPALLVIAAESVAGVFRKLSGRSLPEIQRTAAIAAAGLFAILAIFRSPVYKNDFELFKDAVAKQPESAYAHMHYGLTLAETADVLDLAGAGSPQVLADTRTEALSQFRAAVSCDDFDRMLEPGRVRILIGVLQERLGDAAAARPILLAELDKPQKPYNNVIACQSLARIELQAGHPDIALRWVEKGLMASGPPTGEGTPSPEMTYLKGVCLEALGNTIEARASYQSIPSSAFAYKRAQARLDKLNRP